MYQLNRFPDANWSVFWKPWITQGIRASIKTENKLFASGDQTKYKFYRNKINHRIQISKRRYVHDYFDIIKVNEYEKHLGSV